MLASTGCYGPVTGTLTAADGDDRVWNGTISCSRTGSRLTSTATPPGSGCAFTPTPFGQSDVTPKGGEKTPTTIGLSVEASAGKRRVCGQRGADAIRGLRLDSIPVSTARASRASCAAMKGNSVCVGASGCKGGSFWKA